MHRLLTIGVIDDYTVDYSAGELRVRLSGADNHRVAEAIHKYIAAYQRAQANVVLTRLARRVSRPHSEFVLEASRELIEFVYGVVERSRRQALSEMLALCEQCPDEASMRKRLLEYLGTSSFSEGVDLLLDAPAGGLKPALEVLERVCSALDASQLRGESGRALESYPDHAGLRLLRAGAEAMSAEPNPSAIGDNIEACVRFAVSKYGLPGEDVVGDVVAAIRLVGEGRCGVAKPMIEGLLRGMPDKRSSARRILAELPRPMSGPAAGFLLGLASSRVRRLTEG